MIGGALLLSYVIKNKTKNNTEGYMLGGGSYTGGTYGGVLTKKSLPDTNLKEQTPTITNYNIPAPDFSGLNLNTTSTSRTPRTSSRTPRTSKKSYSYPSSHSRTLFFKATPRANNQPVYNPSTDTFRFFEGTPTSAVSSIKTKIINQSKSEPARNKNLVDFLSSNPSYLSSPLGTNTTPNLGGVVKKTDTSNVKPSNSVPNSVWNKMTDAEKSASIRAQSRADSVKKKTKYNPFKTIINNLTYDSKGGVAR